MADFHRRKREQLTALLTRPAIYATCGRDVQNSGLDVLRDLCALDGAEWPDWVGPFLHRFGKLGIDGAFHGTFDDGDYKDEVASVLAEIATRMHSFEAGGPLLTEVAHRRLGSLVREMWEDRDVAYDEAVGALPEPTLVTGGRVVSFASESGEWLHLDFERQTITRYDRAVGGEVREQGELLLRDVRLPAATFDDALVLTLFGRYRRWGPGSWIDQPPLRDADPSRSAIAEQLRTLRAKVPSQRR